MLFSTGTFRKFFIKIRYKRAKRKSVRKVRANSQATYLLHKSKALYLATVRLEHFNKFYNFKTNKITIRNQVSRWGSCSKRGNLSFNYRIALLSPELADYII